MPEATPTEYECVVASRFDGSWSCRVNVTRPGGGGQILTAGVTGSESLARAHCEAAVGQDKARRAFAPTVHVWTPAG